MFFVEYFSFWRGCLFLPNFYQFYVFMLSLSLSLSLFLSKFIFFPRSLSLFSRLRVCYTAVYCLLWLIYPLSFWLTSMLPYGLLLRMFIVPIRLLLQKKMQQIHHHHYHHLPENHPPDHPETSLVYSVSFDMQISKLPSFQFSNVFKVNIE